MVLVAPTGLIVKQRLSGKRKYQTMSDAIKDTVLDEGLSTLFQKAVEMMAENFGEAISLMVAEQQETNRLLRRICEQGNDDFDLDKVTQAVMLLKKCDGVKSRIATVLGVSTRTMERSKEWAPFRVAYAMFNNREPNPEDVEITSSGKRTGIISDGVLDGRVEVEWEVIDRQLDRR